MSQKLRSKGRPFESGRVQEYFLNRTELRDCDALKPRCGPEVDTWMASAEGGRHDVEESLLESNVFDNGRIATGRKRSEAFGATIGSGPLNLNPIRSPRAAEPQDLARVMR